MDGPYPFRVERSAILKHLLLQPSSGWPVWTALITGFILIASSCFSDIRLMVLGLMICFAVAPSITAFIYFAHVLSPGLMANLLPHTIERNADGYTLRIWRSKEAEDGEDVVEGWIETGCILLYDADIVAAKASSEYEMLFFSNAKIKILYLPRS